MIPLDEVYGALLFIAFAVILILGLGVGGGILVVLFAPDLLLIDWIARRVRRIREKRGNTGAGGAGRSVAE
jgi:hypothetical protein